MTFRCHTGVYIIGYDDDCFYYQYWKYNVVIAFGTLASFLTQLHVASSVVCIVCPFAGDEQLVTMSLVKERKERESRKRKQRGKEWIQGGRGAGTEEGGTSYQ